MVKVNNNNKLTALISKNKEVKTILQELDTQIKKSCQAAGCPDFCRQTPTPPQRVLNQLTTMENQDDWETKINDPDFRWTDYKQELQGELIELSGKYSQHSTSLKNLARDLREVKSLN